MPSLSPKPSLICVDEEKDFVFLGKRDRPVYLENAEHDSKRYCFFKD